METLSLDQATEYLSSTITEILDTVAPVETKKMGKKTHKQMDYARPKNKPEEWQ